MEEMFKVHAPPIPLLLAHTPPRTVCPAPCVPVSTRQNAKAFNQPLNFNTSSVTTMDTMFYVCTSPAPCAQTPVEPSLARCMRGRRPTDPPSSWPTPRPAFDSAESEVVQPASELRHVPRHEHGSHVQGALCPRALRPDSSRAFPCTLHARPPPHRSSSLCLPARTSPHIVCAGREGVQPASELRHVPRHRHDRDVQGALRPYSALRPSLAFLCLHASRAAQRAAAAPRRPPRNVFPPFDSAGREGFQPASELRHIQGQRHGRNVRGALYPCPAPRLQSSLLLHAACAAAAPRRPPRIVYPLSTRQRAGAFDQPLNFDTSSVINMDEMFEVHVSLALRLDPSLLPEE